MISGAARIAGVMGWPVSHSLSPRLHNYWIAKYGLDAAYVPFPGRPDDLPELFRILPKLGVKGWNLTVPHKQAALLLVDDVDDEARAIGAVNTVVVHEDGRLSGRNTDALGFAENLRAQAGHVDFAAVSALVLGAGGAARAVCRALLNLGVRHIAIANRTESNAAGLAAQMGGAFSIVPWEEKEKALKSTTLLVNATTLGMQNQSPLELDVSRLPPGAVVADIVYAPLMTELLTNAQAQGCAVVTGLGMLIHQARPGFAAWFGITPEVTPELEKVLLS